MFFSHMCMCVCTIQAKSCDLLELEALLFSYMQFVVAPSLITTSICHTRKKSYFTPFKTSPERMFCNSVTNKISETFNFIEHSHCPNFDTTYCMFMVHKYILTGIQGSCEWVQRDGQSADVRTVRCYGNCCHGRVRGCSVGIPRTGRTSWSRMFSNKYYVPIF